MRASVRAALPIAWLARESRAAWRSSVEYRAELLVTLAFLAGWALLTHAVAAVVSARVPVWELSGGLLLVSLCGWKFVGLYFWIGLYTATRKRRDG